MTDQVDDDGFVKVERFKYKPVNNANKKKNKKRNKHIFKDPEEWTLEDVNKTLEERKSTLMSSRFYKALLVLFEENLTKPKDIVCYGIGSVQRLKNAQYQFILALLLRDILEISGDMYIYDPVMTKLDEEICQHYSIKVIQENEHGKRAIEEPTLFYMPHCGRGLYSNTLSANWTSNQLDKLTIIGNDFELYVGSQLEKDLKRECPYLIPAVDIVKAISFPPEFDNNQIFNDLSIQTFPLEKLSQVDESFWTTVYQDGSQEKHDKE